MKSVKFMSVLIVLIITGSYAMVRSMVFFVPIGQVGVRIQQYDVIGKKGVVKKDFGPGWHRDLGPVDSWELYDGTVQTLEMTKDSQYGSEHGRDDVKVQSIEGNHISLDVTVKYQLQKGMVHKLYQDTGRGFKYRAIVRVEAEKACMDLFGKLATEEFYDPSAKRHTADEVQRLLKIALEDNFIEILDVLIRDVEFDPEYEAKIRKKKLADQEVQLNISMANAEKMRGKTQVIEAETKKLLAIIIKEKDSDIIKMQAQNDLDVAMIQAQYEKYRVEKMADADLIKAQNEAKGGLLVKKAEAEGERLRNEAMQGSGGDVIVALEAAKNLNMSAATISTLHVDLLDVDGMVDRLGLAGSK